MEESVYNNANIGSRANLEIGVFQENTMALIKRLFIVCNIAKNYMEVYALRASCPPRCAYNTLLPGGSSPFRIISIIPAKLFPS
jgi:hypothetical protein